MQRRGKLLVSSDRDPYFLGGNFSFFPNFDLKSRIWPVIYLSQVWNLKFQRFFVNIFKNKSKFKKMKRSLLDNFILFLKINESHFLIKPNFCYAVQEKLNGYHGYWWISRKPHNFTKICGHHWIHLAFSIPEMCTFVHFCASLLSNEMHKKPHFLFVGLGWHQP